MLSLRPSRTHRLAQFSPVRSGAASRQDQLTATPLCTAIYDTRQARKREVAPTHHSMLSVLHAPTWHPEPSLAHPVLAQRRALVPTAYQRAYDTTRHDTTILVGSAGLHDLEAGGRRHGASVPRCHGATATYRCRARRTPSLQAAGPIRTAENHPTSPWRSRRQRRGRWCRYIGCRL
jgi:hypothetical protein